MPTVVDIPPRCPNAAMQRCLRGCSPHLHPHRWGVVNSIVLIWSLILGVHVWNTADTHIEDELSAVEREYIIWNFVTCAVWVVEIALNVLDYRGYFDKGGFGESSLLQQPATERKEKTKNELIAMYTEVFLAVYFFLDSCSIAVNLLDRNEVHKYASAMTFDVVIGMIAYTFLVYRQYVDYKSAAETDESEIEQQSLEQIENNDRYEAKIENKGANLV